MSIASVPAPLRFALGTLEPSFAIVGAVLLLRRPEHYLRSLDPDGDDHSLVHTATRMALIQLAGTWTLFGLLKLWLYRSTLARQHFRSLLKIALVSDAFHIASLIPLGRHLATSFPRVSAESLATVGITISAAAARVFLLVKD